MQTIVIIQPSIHANNRKKIVVTIYWSKSMEEGIWYVRKRLCKQQQKIDVDKKQQKEIK